MEPDLPVILHRRAGAQTAAREAPVCGEFHAS
jgi:hypothetical protein